MKTIIKRVNITLPEATLSKIDHVAPRGDRSQFIDQAVNFYMRETTRKHLRAALKEGAMTRASRDRALAEEWCALEEVI